MHSSLLTLYAIVLADLLTLLVGIAAWIRNPHSTFASSFFLVTFAGIFWATCNYYSYTTTDLQLTISATRVTLAAGVWLLVSICYFALRFPTELAASNLLRQSLIPIALIGGAFSMSRLVASDISIIKGVVVLTPGPAYVLYIVMLLALSGLALYLLYRQYLQAGLVARNQIRYVSFGIGFAAIAGIILNGVLPIFYPTVGGAKVNLLLIILFILFVGYGLIRNRYIDIHTLGSKSVTYLGCVGLLALVLEVSKHILDSGFHRQQSVINGLVIIAAIAALVIQPLRNRLELRVNRLVRRHWYDAESTFRRVAEIVASEQRLDPLLQSTLDFLCREIGVTSGAFVVVDGNRTLAAQQFGTKPDAPIQFDLAELTRLRSKSIVVLADELNPDDPKREIMETHQVRMAARLVNADALVGFLVFGTKLSGDIFTRQDVRVLSILSNQLAVAIVRSQAYEEINQFNSTLARRIDEATQELREAHDKLQADDKMKSEFIILTSHNLRTPLSIINGYTEMLSDTGLATTQRKYLDTILASMTKLNKLVDDLLTIATLEGGQQFAHKPEKVSAILLPLVEELKELMKGSTVQLLSSVNVGDEILVDANLPRLSGAIRNVLDNAFKFTREGSIEFTAVVVHGQLELRIHDSGIGISPEELPNIFNKFHRATSVMQYDYDGEGIGLYLSKLIVQEHKGHISVSSKLKKGTEVLITLPLIKATGSDARPKA